MFVMNSMGGANDSLFLSLCWFLCRRRHSGRACRWCTGRDTGTARQTPWCPCKTWRSCCTRPSPLATWPLSNAWSPAALATTLSSIPPSAGRRPLSSAPPPTLETSRWCATLLNRGLPSIFKTLGCGATPSTGRAWGTERMWWNTWSAVGQTWTPWTVTTCRRWCRRRCTATRRRWRSWWKPAAASVTSTACGAQRCTTRHSTATGCPCAP